MEETDRDAERRAMQFLPRNSQLTRLSSRLSRLRAKAVSGSIISEEAPIQGGTATKQETHGDPMSCRCAPEVKHENCNELQRPLSAPGESHHGFSYSAVRGL